MSFDCDFAMVDPLLLAVVVNCGLNAVARRLLLPSVRRLQKERTSGLRNTFQRIVLYL